MYFTMYTGNLYNFINQYHSNRFNKFYKKNEILELKNERANHIKVIVLYCN